VTSGLAIWNAAIQASDALPCDVAPEPLSSPESVLGPSAGGASFVAQEERTMVPATASAAMLPRRVRFPMWSLSRVRGAGPVLTPLRMLGARG
jgi:hypothetical protein